MKIAFTTLACPDWSLEQCVQAVHDYGYDGIELRLIDGQVMGPDADVARIARVCAGVPIVCVDTSVSLAQPDAEIRALQIANGKAMIDIAAGLGARLLRVFGMPPKEADRAQALAAAREAMQALAAYGVLRGVQVLLETHDAFCDSASVLPVVRDVAGAAVLWDLLHPYRTGEAIATSIAAYRDLIAHVHIKDGRRPDDGGENWPLTLLGAGDVPIRDMLAALRSARYDGWISVEWEKKWHPHLEAPEIALPQHIALLREWTQLS
jgi:sugar phosphate isomerase/epimerase